ncbi:hypothetical protein KVV02_006955 [Mortierella alpina]|uniref:Arrestin-like N-terminal domain-containing protein n=1 Tax=Mortierella alpina TaxID=64518 RepID=A0A9P8D1T3_MORAP|nr:hypothetical protein KVV02_006955 [Mortierella alpina]
MFDKKKKSLKIQINHDRTRLGPCGVPLLFGTPERPAVIQGQVVFETDYLCKGGDLEIEYTAQANVEWSEQTSQFSIKGQHNFDHKKITVNLKHAQRNTIEAGRYVGELNLPVDPIKVPSSMTLEDGEVCYKIVARIRRKFPSTDLTVEQHVWVINSSIASPRAALQDCLSPVYLSQKPDPSNKVPGITTSCDLPATAFWAGETIPVVIKAMYATTSLYDNASVFSNESRTGLLPDWAMKRNLDKNGELNLESGLPSISVRLKQTIICKNKSETNEPERSNYAVRFRLNQSAVATQDGWSIGFFVTLPHMSEQSDVPNGPQAHGDLSTAAVSKIVHTADGLKQSVDCPTITVKHSLKIHLEYKAKASNKPLVFKHSTPVSITAPPDGDGIPLRFTSMNWPPLTTFRSENTITGKMVPVHNIRSFMVSLLLMNSRA